MKKIIFVLLLLLSACTTPPRTSYKIKDFISVAPVEIPAKKIYIQNDVAGKRQSPHIEHMMPMPPERVIQNWAYVRLRPDKNKKNKAILKIKEASMTRFDAPQPSLFVKDNHEYILDFDIELIISDEQNNTLKTVQTNGKINRQIPQRSSIDAKDAVYYQMLSEMWDVLDSKLISEIRQNTLDL